MTSLIELCFGTFRKDVHAVSVEHVPEGEGGDEDASSDEMPE